MILTHLIQCSAMQVEDPMQAFWWISHKHYQWPYIHSKTQIQVYNCVHRLNWNAFMTSRDPAFFYKIIMIQFGFNSSEIESIYFLPHGIWTSASCIPPKPRWCRSQQIAGYPRKLNTWQRRLYSLQYPFYMGKFGRFLCFHTMKLLSLKGM